MSSPAQKAREEFIEEFYPIAKEAGEGRNVFPETMLSVAILESSGKVGDYYLPGQSKLAREAKNYFGIKANSAWKGSVYEIDSKEQIYDPILKTYITYTEKSKFRKYKSALDSFKDYVDFLHSNPRYANNGVFDAKTPEAQFKALQKAGYATDPQYASKLMVVFNAMKSAFLKAQDLLGATGLKLAEIITISLMLWQITKQSKRN